MRNITLIIGFCISMFLFTGSANADWLVKHSSNKFQHTLYENGTMTKEFNGDPSKQYHRQENCKHGKSKNCKSTKIDLSNYMLSGQGGSNHTDNFFVIYQYQDQETLITYAYQIYYELKDYGTPWKVTSYEYYNDGTSATADVPLDTLDLVPYYELELPSGLSYTRTYSYDGILLGVN